MLGELYAIGAAMLWAISSILTKRVVDRADIFVLNFVRLIFASIFSFVIYIAIRGFEFDISFRSLFFLTAGATLAIIFGDALYFRSMQFAAISRVIPISSTYPLFTIFIAYLLLGEPITVSILIGTVLIVFGVSLLGLKNESDTGEEKDVTKGVSLALITAVTWASGITVMKMGLTGTDPFLGNVMRLPFLIPLVYLIVIPRSGYKKPFQLKKEVYICMSLAGITALAIGATLFLMSMSILESTAEATALSSTTPLFATLFAVIFLKEKIDLKRLTGTLLVVFGIWRLLS